MGGIKIRNFYASPLRNDKTIMAEDLGYIKKDEKGNEYALVDENSVAFNQNDTIRPADNKLFKKGVIDKSQGSVLDLNEGKNALMGGDYNVVKQGDKSFKITE